ncbi:DUF1963 domain-containing protein [Patescibacteria group bacterium]|nr:DUF1963 domain-containing protein [Patescibacteria group bacterium]
MPNELSPFIKVINSTEENFIRIKTGSPKKDLGFITSKFGGKPYVLDPTDYPTAKNGNKLILLAQINFDDVPNIKDFPNSGILQSFIADNDLRGLNFNNQTMQDTFRIVYFPKDKVNENKAIKDFDWPYPNEDFVFKKEFPLKYSLQKAPMSPFDFRFEQKIPLGNPRWDLQEKPSDWYWEYSQCTGHKIGGFPRFTQVDPRSDQKNKEYTKLLLQIDSEYDKEKSEYKIIWGDAGVANFFIKPRDLSKLNFGDVIYNWDCY